MKGVDRRFRTCQLRVDGVEKVVDFGGINLRHRSETSETAAQFARAVSLSLQDRDNQFLATPPGQNFQNHLYGAEIFGPESNGDFLNTIGQEQPSGLASLHVSFVSDLDVIRCNFVQSQTPLR